MILNNGDHGLIEIMKAIEHQMWDAFCCGDSGTFSKLVSADAMMICGGYRESGAEYTGIVAQVRLDGYRIDDFIVKVLAPDTALTNYIVEVSCSDAILSGTFRVSSLWRSVNGDWQLVFNQDTRL